jgi:phosphopantetheine--protein transferase-like protein
MRMPFNSNYSLGTDITKASRFLDATKPDWKRLVRLNKSWLNPDEQATLLRRFPLLQDPAATSEKTIDPRLAHGIACHVAGLWAAKEAAKKAWGADLLSFRQMKIWKDDFGMPRIRCFLPEDGVERFLKNKGRITSQEAAVSISHDGDFTIAVVMAKTLHPQMREAFIKLKSEAELKVKGERKLAPKSEPESETPDYKKEFFPTGDPVFDDFVDVNNNEPKISDPERPELER